MRGHTPEFLIKRRAARPPFPRRWEAGAGGGPEWDEYDELPFGPDGQAGVGEWMARKEVREETGLEVGEPTYLGTFRFVRFDGVKVFGIRYFAQAITDDVVLGEGASDFRWITAYEAPPYGLIGQALEDMRAVTTMYELIESEDID
jgi:8-oxo-dGTP pyrophosphatase MutT (NUDIX family)